MNAVLVFENLAKQVGQVAFLTIKRRRGKQLEYLEGRS